MKNKMILLMLSGVCISYTAFSQDTAHTSQLPQDTVLNSHVNNNEKIISYRNQNNLYNKPGKKPMYRDTRLGSSSPMYDTYKKNDYGAGAITNNPNK